MRVFTGSLYTETNTFSPLPCGLAAFRDRGYYPAGTHPDELLFYAGPLWAARQRAKELGWVLHEGMVASAQPAGRVTRQAYEALRDELLADLKAAMPVDMVVLALHGAMVADGYDDCEGDVLTRVRQIVGRQAVVGAELDPHCHLSECMVEQADLLICFKEYPHTDVAERAFELVDRCAGTVTGHVRPVASVVDCDMIVTVHTTRAPARGFVDRMSALEQQPGVLSVSLAHGFAWGDTPDMGTKVLVYTDAMVRPAPQQGQALARQLADELIGLREQLVVQGPGIDEALDQALALGCGPVVLADSADNPGGGAAGDSTFLLQRLLARGIGAAALGPLWDPIAVRFAFEAGVGAQLPLRVGGKTGPMSGVPVDADLDGEGAGAQHDHEVAVWRRHRTGRLRLCGDGGRAGGPDDVAQPGLGHRSLHAAGCPTARAAHRGGEVFAALLHGICSGGRTGDLRQCPWLGAIRSAAIALPQGQASEVAAG
jgi:microcystin degradation protein MlrC